MSTKSEGGGSDAGSVFSDAVAGSKTTTLMADDAEVRFMRHAATSVHFV
jgi:hypothetical protein